MLSEDAEGMLGAHGKSPGETSLRHTSDPRQNGNFQGGADNTFLLLSPSQPLV